MRQNLEFRGSSTVLFGDILVVVLLSILTLGLYVPWGYARLRRAVLSRTYYHDKPLQFDGTGGQLFGTYLKILLRVCHHAGYLRSSLFPHRHHTQVGC